MNTLFAICIILAIVFVALLSYIFLLRNLQWGATRDEMHKSMPGDELIAEPRSTITRAITIEASPAEVWPWLIQMGYGRAGWYNYDWINRLLGAADYVDGHHSATRIVPELQHLEVGDKVLVASGAELTVTDVEQNNLLSLFTEVNLFTTSWVYTLNESGNETSRLIVRHRGMYKGFLIHFIFTAGSLIQERKHLLGIKRRAEEKG
ncbi:MAG TPA: SRPBCC family protein [Syntrophomonadaceae bacterium]|nr:SRPBCC family protein [Syntrophomonadaceae bacterium]